jgi:hypothetical protein
MFSSPFLSTPTSLSVALPRELPGFPHLSLQPPPELQPDRSTLMSGSLQHQSPDALLLPQDDLVMTGILSNMNQLCNVSSNLRVQPIDRIRMNIPTAAELSGVFSDEEKSIHSGSSMESICSNQNRYVARSAMQLEFQFVSNPYSTQMLTTDLPISSLLSGRGLLADGIPTAAWCQRLSNTKADGG